MKPRTVLLFLGAILLFVLLVRACAIQGKKSVNAALGGVFVDKDAIFYDTDFTTGDYAIILDDEPQALVIDDAVVLEENKNRIKTDINWMTYLPAEGGRGFHGIRLFKNNQLQHAILGRKFNTFQTGDLRKHGKPVALKFINEPREAYLRKKDSLEKLPDTYMARTTELDSMGYDYRFTVRFPSILVSQEDTIFDAHAYGKALAQRVKNSLGHFEGFRTGNDATEGAMTSPILMLKIKGSERYLEDSETGRYLSLKGYVLHSSKLIFFGTKEFYEKIQAQDFGDSFRREGLSEAEIKALIQDKIGPDSAEVQMNAVFESMFKTGIEIGGLHENKYELRYYSVTK
ncbi:hypothetical protein [Maribacter sp. 2307ULW6-5]|uniref:hypothetical protein n=1 Tax=Maribacter sp. 2307ULW6-5 TaxID=3386275 RepID=UPI0039BC7609